MSSNFPSAPDTIVNNVSNATPELDTHPNVHNQLADAVMAVQTSLLAGGTLSLADHVAAADPHPTYLTKTEGDALYTPIGGGLTLPLSQHLTFSPDNTYDIGASGANRPRNVYVANQISAPSIVASATGGGQFLGQMWTDWAGEPMLIVPAGGQALEQRNGTAAQTFRIYNTYTDASNYERLNIFWSSNQAWLQTQNGGTGTARQLALSGNVLSLGGVLGAQNWFVWFDSRLLAGADNASDIGASGSNRPRSVYIGSAYYTAMNTAAQGPGIWGGSGAPATGLGAVGDVYHRSDTPSTSLQRMYVKTAAATWTGVV